MGKPIQYGKISPVDTMAKSIELVLHGGGATQSMKIEPPNPFGQSHAIHY